MPTIRRAEERDTEDILRLLVQVNMVHHEGRPDLFNGPVTKYSPAELHEIIHNDKTPIFVCAKDEQVLGYAFCVLQEHIGERLMADRKTLYIDDLCVDEDARGQHIGQALYQHVLNYAKSIGCQSVTLNVWAFNEPAMRFYEKCGLKPYKIGMEQVL